MLRKLVTVFAVTAGVVLLASAPAFAQFHSAGNLVCTKCHTMHNTDGAGADLATGPTPHLLKADSASDLCLQCHDTAGTQATYSYGGSTPPKVKGVVVNQLPGGIFDSASPTRGHTMSSFGADPNNVNSPGGAYAQANLSCSSCHDAHGTGGTTNYAYRLLLKTVNGNDTTADAITSVAASGATLTSAGAAADQNADCYAAGNHNVYKGGFGEWCSSCHGTFHGKLVGDANVGDGTDWIRHPTGTVFPNAYTTNYGATYDPTYPVVTTLAGAGKAANWAIGNGESYVFCMSCHKAHGSGYSNATRWDLTTGDAGGNTKCGKCHAK